MDLIDTQKYRFPINMICKHRHVTKHQYNSSAIKFIRKDLYLLTYLLTYFLHGA